jgi:uncharacterized protein (UPF0335 family)
MSGAGHNARSLLQAGLERLEEIQAEIDELKGSLKAEMKELASHGFDKAAVGKVLKIRKKGVAKHTEEEAIVELYLAAIGMSGGQALSDAARRRMAMAEKPDPADDGEGVPDLIPDDEPARGEITDADLVTARTEGAAACEAGQGIMSNPYVAGDPRRSSWDEGWCGAAGSDGMDIPKAFQRPKKDKKGDGKAGGGAE